MQCFVDTTVVLELEEHSFLFQPRLECSVFSSSGLERSKYPVLVFVVKNEFKLSFSVNKL